MVAGPIALSSGRMAAYRRVCFVTEGPKPREIFAADFRDRIVHHLLVSRTEPLFECRFIHDSYACRKGKGVLAASDRLTEFLRQVTANGRRPAWALKLDVASFFPSIHKQTLSEILARRFGHPPAQAKDLRLHFGQAVDTGCRRRSSACAVAAAGAPEAPPATLPSP